MGKQIRQLPRGGQPDDTPTDDTDIVNPSSVRFRSKHPQSPANGLNVVKDFLQRNRWVTWGLVPPQPCFGVLRVSKSPISRPL